MSNNTALLIAYYFAPTSDPGVYRPLKFCKYLPKYNWNTITIAASHPTYHQDPGLCEDLAPQSSIIYIPYSPPIHSSLTKFISQLPYVWRLAFHFEALFSFPDEKLKWAKRVFDRAQSLCKKNHIPLIFTTSYPFSSHFVGLWLKRKLGICWIADFRDPWLDGPGHMASVPKWARPRHLRCEQKVAQNADHILFAHPDSKDSFRTRFDISENKISCIPNGYDPEDFHFNHPTRHTSGRYQIVHLGTFYGPYNPAPLKRALLLARTTDPGLLSMLRLVFIGGTPICFDDIEELDVQITPRLSHQEALAHLQKGDIALNVYENSCGSHNISGKLYEYLASSRPILAIVPESGATAKIIKTCQAGVVADPDKPQDIIAAIKKCMQLCSAEKSFFPNYSAISQYDRFVQTGQLAQIFQAALAKNRKHLNDRL